jgi:protein-S-isoprenylcysteine O-methyltransferase Ste14
LATASLLRVMLTLALLIFFALKARYEESWLQQRYSLYATYKERVKKFTL